MSYRALLSIYQDDATTKDFMVGLGDLWDQAERLSEIALKAKSPEAAIQAIHEVKELGLDPSLRTFDSDEARQAWIDTYADQLWTVVFDRKGEYVEGRIVGRDAHEQMIFFRKRCYHVG